MQCFQNVRRPLAVGLVMAVASLAHGEQATITLSTGESITVDVISMDAENVTFSHPVLGEVTVPRADVTLPQDVIDSMASSDAAEAAAAGGADIESDASEWENRFILASAYVTGNSESASLAVQLRGIRDTDEMKTTLEGSFFYAESDGVRSENRATAYANNDWKLPDSRWFYFGRAQFDYDSYQDWDTRLGLYGGPGYHLYDLENFSMNVRAGLGAIREWGSMNDDIQLELLLGVDGVWTISDHQSLEFASTVYPNLSETGEFRMVNSLAWSVVVDEHSNMSLAAGVLHEYQSDVDPPTKEHDVRVFAGLQFDFQACFSANAGGRPIAGVR